MYVPVVELIEQCVEKGYYNPKTKLKMKCKYIETSDEKYGKLKNLEITVMPKPVVFAGIEDLNNPGKYSQSKKK